MPQDTIILLITAVSIGFFHTLFGPDHYLPFIVMAKARKWTISKTTFITFLCGIGHIGSSVLLGLVGIALGIAVSKLEAFESFRGDIATWMLIAFGLVYFVWGLRRAIRNRPHRHIHLHQDGDHHIHEHIHQEEHLHVHSEQSPSITPWILFTVFVFGPCEPLIPILMYPAAQRSILNLTLVTVAFGSITIFTMLGIVLAGVVGFSFIPMARLERYNHALAGASILLCGIAIQVFGL